MKGRRKSQRSSNQVTVVGTDQWNLSYSASYSFNNQPFKPSAIGRLATLRTCFELYRLNWIRFESLPSCTGPVTMGWLAGETGGSFVGWNNGVVANLRPSTCWWPSQTNTMKLRVGPSDIGMQYKWLLTTDATGQAGNLFIGGPSSTAVTCYVRVTYSVTFKSPVYQGFQTVDRPLSNEIDQDDNKSLIEDYANARALAPPARVDRGVTLPKQRL